MFGVDPTPIPSKANGPERSSEISPIEDTEWIRAEVNPLLEAVTMDGPETVIVEKNVEVKAYGHQAGNLTFPLEYPASVNWSGSKNVFIGTGEALNNAKESNQYDAVLDTATGTLTRLSAGEISLTVESSGVVAQKHISVY